jgi:hypothetical protein
LSVHTLAVLDVLAERRRQKDAEGWTPAHDDKHEHGEMALAASCYAFNAGRRQRFQDAPDLTAAAAKSSGWPWDAAYWKPKNLRRDLVRAGALILAEIERLDRLEDRRRESA